MPITRTRDYDPNVPVSAGGRSGEGVVRTASGEEIRFTPQEAMPQPQPQQIQDPQEAMPQGQAFRIPPQLQNRNKYESFLQSKYGDPWEDERNLANRSRDMESLINDTSAQEERGFFDHVFGGQYRYEDLEKLDKRALDHWQNQKLILRKNVENQHKQNFEAQMQDIEVRKDQMGEQMKVFDNYVKMFKPEKPEKQAKSRYGAKTVLDMVQGIQDRGTPVTDSEMITFEEMTKDMPIEVKHEITQESEKRGFMGIDFLRSDVPERASLSIKRKSGTSTNMRKAGEGIADWEKRTKSK